MSTEDAKATEFIKNLIVSKILNEEQSLKNQKLVDCACQKSLHSDGFMSTIFMVDLKTQDNCFVTTTTNFIVKLMKGDHKFREDSKSYIQCFNEVYIYNNVIKYYSKFLNEKNFQLFSVDDWCPKNYFCSFGKFPELSNMDEAVLVLENLTGKGYRSGPRLELDEKHLMLMMKTIAPYHSMTYALRILKDPMLEALVAGIKPLPFVEPNGETNLYTAVYGIALDRLFDFLDKSPEHMSDPKFVKNVENFKTKYWKTPLVLMENFRTDEKLYSVILHGDYNRNNVLFKYDQPEGFDNPIDLKMIDFQEIRYGSPALDLSFFMFMNIDRDLRPKVWIKLLKFYHETLYNSLAAIVGCKLDDERLSPYRYESFYEHFSRFAFYGAMVAVHFIPWMASSEEEIKLMSHYFETDMFNPEFKKIVMVAGGKEPNEKITAVIKFASEMGYMDFLN